MFVFICLKDYIFFFFLKEKNSYGNFVFFPFCLTVYCVCGCFFGKGNKKNINLNDRKNLNLKEETVWCLS